MKPLFVIDPAYEDISSDKEEFTDEILVHSM